MPAEKSMMSKHKAITSLLALLVAAAYGCVAAPPLASDRLIVAVSVQPQVEFVSRVGGDRVAVIVLVPAGANPHTYEVTPSQMAGLSRAKAYFKVGSPIEFELAWLDKLSAANRGMAVTDCSSGIDLMRSEDPDEPGLDPHIWTSPHNVKIMINNICAGLTQAYPEGKDSFESNRDAYAKELDGLDTEIRAVLKGITNRTFIVYHPAWGYFARDYGLKQMSIEQEGKEPKAAYLARLVQEARNQNTRIIFISPAFDARNAEAVAREINGKVVIIDPLSGDYLNNMRKVVNALREALR